jgi:hypothetical protein
MANWELLRLRDQKKRRLLVIIFLLGKRFNESLPLKVNKVGIQWQQIAFDIENKKKEKLEVKK